MIMGFILIALNIWKLRFALIVFFYLDNAGDEWGRPALGGDAGHGAHAGGGVEGGSGRWEDGGSKV